MNAQSFPEWMMVATGILLAFVVGLIPTVVMFIRTDDWFLASITFMVFSWTTGIFILIDLADFQEASNT